jgi:hypothetical protein
MIVKKQNETTMLLESRPCPHGASALDIWHTEQHSKIKFTPCMMDKTYQKPQNGMRKSSFYTCEVMVYQIPEVNKNKQLWILSFGMWCGLCVVDWGTK